MNWLLTLLENWGRKYVMVSERGEVIVEKYVLIGSRNGRWIRWPSVCLHHFVYLGRDQFPHTHVGNFVSVILTGGYQEATTDGSLRWLRAPALNVMRHTDYHDIRQILPNTWTLFFMGWHRQPYQVAKPGRRPLKYKNLWQKVTPELHARLEKLRRRAARAHPAAVLIKTVELP